MKQKVNIGTALMIAFAVTLITGVILFVKYYGIVFQPRCVFKVVHWVLGYAMAVTFFIHWAQFEKMLSAMRAKVKWFYIDTWLLIVFFIATLLTGIVKQFTPVRIPYLGMWHSYIGFAMSALALIHLVRGIPSWSRIRKSCK